MVIRKLECVFDWIVLKFAVDMNLDSLSKSKNASPDKLVETCIDVSVYFAQCGSKEYPVFDLPDNNSEEVTAKGSTKSRFVVGVI